MTITTSLFFLEITLSKTTNSTAAIKEHSVIHKIICHNFIKNIYDFFTEWQASETHQEMRNKKIRGSLDTGLEIMAGQRTMSSQNKELSGQTVALPVILTSHLKFNSVGK